MTKTTEQKIFDNLVKIGIIGEDAALNFNEHIRLKSGAYMDLVVEDLITEDDRSVISMSHYGLQNGDVMADPDMEVEVNQTARSVRALSYRNDYVGVYQHIEDTPRLQRDLNSFLLDWTKNLIDQGFAVGKGGAEHNV